MEALGIIGFIFGLSAIGMASASTGQVKKLKDELEELKKEVKELRGGQESGEAK